MNETIAPMTGRFWCVENFSLAQVLSPEEQEEMHQFMTFNEFKAGDTIYFPGDPSDTVYSISQGKVSLTYLDQSGKRLTFAIISRGQLFGETALAGEEKRHWLAEAIEDSIVCSIGRDELLAIAETKAQISAKNQCPSREAIDRDSEQT